MLGFLGVLVIVRPGLASFQPMALLVLFAALMYGISLTVTKQLTNRVSTFAIIFWMNLMQLPMNFAGSHPLFFLKLDASMMLPVLGVAVAGLAIHYCLTNAFRYGDAMIVIPMDFLRVQLVAVVGWMFYGERLDIFVFAGAALIVTGVLWNVRGEARRSDTAHAPVAPRSTAIQAAKSF